MLGVGILAWGAIGLYTSDSLGSAIGITPTKEDEEKLRNTIRITPIEHSDTK